MAASGSGWLSSIKCLRSTSISSCSFFRSRSSASISRSRSRCRFAKALPLKVNKESLNWPLCKTPVHRNGAKPTCNICRRIGRRHNQPETRAGALPPVPSLCAVPSPSHPASPLPSFFSVPVVRKFAVSAKSKDCCVTEKLSTAPHNARGNLLVSRLLLAYLPLQLPPQTSLSLFVVIIPSPPGYRTPGYAPPPAPWWGAPWPPAWPHRGPAATWKFLEEQLNSTQNNSTWARGRNKGERFSGRQELPTMSQVLSSVHYISFLKTSGSNMGAPRTCFSAPSATWPRYAPDWGSNKISGLMFFCF